MLCSPIVLYMLQPCHMLLSGVAHIRQGGEVEVSGVLLVNLS